MSDVTARLSRHISSWESAGDDRQHHDNNDNGDDDGSNSNNDDGHDSDAYDAATNYNVRRNASRQVSGLPHQPSRPRLGQARAARPEKAKLLRTYSQPDGVVNEQTSLLAHESGHPRFYRAVTASQEAPQRPRLPYAFSARGERSRRNSFIRRPALTAAATSTSNHGHAGLHGSDAALHAQYSDERVWYDQFTSTDWVYDSIEDAHRVKQLRSRKGFVGRVAVLLDGAQSWFLMLFIGSVTAGFAYAIDVTEATVFDLKSGYCRASWWYSRRQCCDGANICDGWVRWSRLLHASDDSAARTDFGIYVAWVIGLAVLSCLITLLTKTTVSPTVSLATLDENLGAERHPEHGSERDLPRQSAKTALGRHIRTDLSPVSRFRAAIARPPTVYYPAAGSGVAEVRVILSGFVLHGYLGAQTLVTKTVGLVFSIASGLSVGKEGPYVHLATCVGNIACRMCGKYKNNDSKRREVMSAAAAAGIAVAFGSPIGGVLFSLEEVSYYFPRKALFRTFFCAIAAALSLRFLDPYGTEKIVLFEVRYLTDWRFFELAIFALLGALGGILGALFIKASRFWAQKFRSLSYIKRYPLLEVVLVAAVTGLVSPWSRFARLPVAELMYELAAPCNSFSSSGDSLCPTEDKVMTVIGTLSIAFAIKAVLTTVTFGIKVPAGIYVPSMVVGGLLGRIVGHFVQLVALSHPGWLGCPPDGSPESCVVPGAYAMVAAGATMCGVTRLSITLAVILFELTGSLSYVLPFSLGVLMAKWTADAIEPLSIYDLLTDMNAYPYLDAKERPIFTTDLGDITPASDPKRSIDISASPLISARHLRMKLDYMHMSGELDGGLPILRDGVLVGLIPGPSLEFALDRLQLAARNNTTKHDNSDSETDFDSNADAGDPNALCFMNPHQNFQDTKQQRRSTDTYDDQDTKGPTFHGLADLEQEFTPGFGTDTGVAQLVHLLAPPAHPTEPTDFTPFIDPAPVALDVCSSLDLVFECFVKLGLRYICVVRDGRFIGLVHRKTFVRYVKSLQKKK